METTDRNDKGINKPTESGQNESYLVLSKEEIAKGFIRPIRRTYIHIKCGHSTSMSLGISETYARDPNFYDKTFCTGCGVHLPVNEFRWYGTEELVGS